jgi:hypothetical protein
MRRPTSLSGGTKSTCKVQTTLRLPRQLYERAKLLVENGVKGSVNDLMVHALAAYVRVMDRKAIDDAFRPMASDKRYQREALRFTQLFSATDAETIETRRARPD